MQTHVVKAHSPVDGSGLGCVGRHAIGQQDNEVSTTDESLVYHSKFLLQVGAVGIKTKLLQSSSYRNGLNELLRV